MNSLPPEINRFLTEVREIDGVEAAWLIGSRVNGEPKATSDWDVILFATARVIEILSSRWPKGVADLDVLVVYDGENFRSPWPRLDTGTFKRGTLSNWEWKESRTDEAVYTERKPAGGEHIDVSDARGILLFRNPEGGAV